MFYAQAFQPETHDYVGVVELEGSSDHNVYIDNLLDTGIYFGWKMVENTCPDEWTWDLCDYGFCYGSLPGSGFMTEVPAGDSGFLKLTVWSNGMSGSGYVHFWVFEADDIDNHQSVKFWFNMDPVTNVITLERENLACSAFPNPTADILFVDISQEVESIVLVNSAGQRVKTIVVVGEGRQTVDLSRMPSGLYTLLAISSDSIHTQHILKQ